MAYVSMKVLSETLNIDQIAEDAHSQWVKRENKRRSLERWLVRLIPIGLLVMAVVFYLLSAPHTAGIVNLITPEYGKLAPIAWELGIVIMSALIEGGLRTRLSKGVLWTLVYMSIAINVAGSFIAVVESGSGSMDITRDTMAQLFGRYGTLPATYQVVLLLVIPIGAVIPLIAKAVGEILIKLAMGRIKLETESDEMKWVKERTRVVYGALFNAALKAGAGSATAGNWAQSIAERIFKEPVFEEPAAISQQRAAATNTAQPQPAMGFSAYAQTRLGQSQDSLGQSNTSPLSSENSVVSPVATSKDTFGQSTIRLSRKDVAEWLNENAAIAGKHPRELCRLYMREKHGIDSDSGYKSFERAKKEMGL